MNDPREGDPRPTRRPAPVSRRQREAAARRHTGPVRFPVGEVLSKTWGVFLKFLPLWLVLGAIAHAPAHFYKLSQIRPLPADPTFADLLAAAPGHSGGASPLWIVELALGLAVQVFTTHVVLVCLDGRRVRLGDTLGVAGARFPAVLGTSLLMLVPLIGFSIVAAILAQALPVELVLLLLLAPFLMLYSMWVVALPVAVAERRAGASALQRSGSLTRGARFPVLGSLCVILIPPLVLHFLLGHLLGGDPDTLEVFDAGNRRRVLWAGLPLNIVSSTLTAILVAVTYRELRVAKEGISSKELADVFA